MLNRQAIAQQVETLTYVVFRSTRGDGYGYRIFRNNGAWAIKMVVGWHTAHAADIAANEALDSMGAPKDADLRQHLNNLAF
jgi:hypothetical protein